MAGIAGDELQHARFSFELAQSLAPKLSVAQRRRMRAAQEQALQRLGDDEVPSGLQHQLGLMTGKQLHRTARQLLETSRLA